VVLCFVAVVLAVLPAVGIEDLRVAADLLITAVRALAVLALAARAVLALAVGREDLRLAAVTVGFGFAVPVFDSDKGFRVFMYFDSTCMTFDLRTGAAFSDGAFRLR
jgi:hypothetical protein